MQQSVVTARPAPLGSSDGPVREYDLTSNWEPIIKGLVALVSCGIPCFGCILWDTVKLSLETEELVVSRKNMCCSSVKRLPYGELAGVEHTRGCGCDGVGGGAFGEPVCPGWGGESELVDEVVGLLRERQRVRGDTAQIKKAEENANKIDELSRKVDALIAHFKVDVPPPTQNMAWGSGQ